MAVLRPYFIKRKFPRPRSNCSSKEARVGINAPACIMKARLRQTAIRAAHTTTTTTSCSGEKCQMWPRDLESAVREFIHVVHPTWAHGWI